MSNLNNTDSILVICESPNKVKTISGILKKAGYANANVTASIGHIMELGNGGPAFNSGIYPAKDFQMNLRVAEDKKKVVNINLKKRVTPKCDPFKFIFSKTYPNIHLL